jgi:ectoine hydroxylase-related dioxygenase (phytanoyl-CoA dioxygenase family)
MASASATPSLSAPDASTLDREGYLLVPGALDPTTMERLRLAFAVKSAADHGTQHIELDQGTPARDAWLALETHPVIVAAARHLFGTAPYRVRSLHGRNPLPGFGQQGLHADWPTRSSLDEVHVMTALWLFDDFTPENGATRLVPGSHRVLEPLPKALAQPHARHPRERLATGAAGSVLVLNGHLWHSGTQNRSAGPRRAAQMVLVRAAASEASQGPEKDAK